MEMLNQIILYIMMTFMVIGALDRISCNLAAGAGFGQGGSGDRWPEYLWSRQSV